MSLDCYDDAKITNYLFPPDELFAADLGLVLGMTAWQRPLARSVELYRSGTVKHLLFTGGFNARAGGIEAVQMADGALSSGVPQPDILIEPAATNTSENMDLAHRLLGRSFGPGRLTSIIIVAIHFHVRRAVLTALRQFAPEVRVGWVTYPSQFYAATDWQHSVRGRADVRAELNKISLYLAQDLSFLRTDAP